METLYRKVILNIVDRCFHMYASDYRKEAKESAIEMLEEIPDPTIQLKADKAELLEALEIFIEQNTPTFTSHDYEFPEHVMKAKSLIQKNKR